ncbi:MAG: hypothetical protein CMB72_06245 [Euryarchaeota archaeon]|nr:hypothetical protein [Euryarchaeota archaeon]
MTEAATVSESTEKADIGALLDAMSPEERKGIQGWYWYDWANQAYALTVMTVIAPQVMASLYNLATGTQSGDAFYAYVLTFSMVFVVLTAPALGVIADKMPIKKKLLKWYTVAGVLFTAVMGAAPYFGSSGYIFLALVYTIGTVGFTGGNVIYYSFMPYLGGKEMQDHVSTYGYVYGFAGGSLLLMFHLVLLLGPFNWDTNFKLAVIFVTSSLWWWGFGALMFKWTPEPEIETTLEWTNLGENNFKRLLSATSIAYTQVFNTAREIRKFKVLALFLVAYLLFYDGVNTIASMASAFGESVLRLDTSMNIMLLLTVNVIAIPMTAVFGKLANIKGTKFALMLALIIYCFVAIAAAAFAPLELDPTTDSDNNGLPDDAEGESSRYDFTFTYNETTGLYEMDTLYNRGYDGWVGENSAGDAEFRDAFQAYFPDQTDSESSSSSTSDLGVSSGILVLLVILVSFVLLGSAIMYLQKMNLGPLTVLLAILLVFAGIFAASLFVDEATVSVQEVETITPEDASSLISAFDNASDHRFSIIVIGPDSIDSEVGDRHPTIVDQGGMVDGWAEFMRDNVWEPFGITVSLQWIILGCLVGMVMGSAGAQARSMFSMLIPETRTSEFFGFFGFLGKSAAMIGTFLYGIASSTFDSRVAIMTITIVILAGTVIASRIDLEEGIRVANEEDARNRGIVNEEVAKKDENLYSQISEMTK